MRSRAEAGQLSTEPSTPLKTTAAAAAREVAGKGSRKRPLAATGGACAPKEENKKQKQANPGDKDNQKVVKSAQALKTKYHKVCSLYAARMRDLQSDPKWSELANPALMQKLGAIKNEVDESTKDPTIREFLSMEWGEFRKPWAKQMGDLVFKLRTFTDESGRTIDELDQELLKLTRRFKA